MIKRLVLLAAAFALSAGCGSKPQEPSPPPSQATVQAAIASTEQKIKDVQNDASIPQQDKQQIIARLQGNIARTVQANRPAAPAPSTTPAAQ